MEDLVVGTNILNKLPEFGKPKTRKKMVPLSVEEPFSGYEDFKLKLRLLYIKEHEHEIKRDIEPYDLIRAIDYISETLGVKKVCILSDKIYEFQLKEELTFGMLNYLFQITPGIRKKDYTVSFCEDIIVCE